MCMYYTGCFPQVTPSILSPMGTWPIYYGNTNLYCQQTQQANTATVYANNQAIAQCCCDAQRMADLRARLDALMMTTNMQEAMREAMRATMPKKKLTLEELNRILFPDDPIRDWSERTLAAIEAKYAWLNDYE